MFIERDKTTDRLVVEALSKREWSVQGPQTGEYFIICRQYNSLKFAGHEVSGQIFALAPFCFYAMLDDVAPTLEWRATQGSHPHVRDDNTLCYAFRPLASLLRWLWRNGDKEAVIELFAEEFTRLPTLFNPNSIASPDWQRCSSCDGFFYKGLLAHCQCGATICFECLGDTGEYVCGACSSTQGAAAKHCYFEHAVLIGAGVTGSWVSQVLLKVASRVWVWDPDKIVPEQAASGAWRCTAPVYKIRALEGPGYHFYRTFTQRYTGHTLPRGSWVIVCTDSANSRLSVLDAANRWAHGILDFRVTPSALVVWAFQTDESEMAKAYIASLQGYPERQPCMDDEIHDNVPLIMGVLAATFLAWWMRTKPSGMWIIPADYGRAWRAT